MTTKHIELLAEPWKVWPSGVIPAEGNRPAWKLHTKEEARRLLGELADSREKHALVSGVSIVDAIREERDER